MRARRVLEPITPSFPLSTDELPLKPGAYDPDLERLSEELKVQMTDAKQRISDRAGLIVERSSAPKPDRKR